MLYTGYVLCGEHCDSMPCVLYALDGLFTCMMVVHNTESVWVHCNWQILQLLQAPVVLLAGAASSMI